MLRRVSALAALGVAAVLPASAGVLLTFPAPPTGDAFYAAHSVIADLSSSSLGWLEAVRVSPRAPAALIDRAMEASPSLSVWDYLLDPEFESSVGIVWLRATGASRPAGGVGGDGLPTNGLAELTSHLGPPDAALQDLDKPEPIDF
jgi:hypothetical protein